MNKIKNMIENIKDKLTGNDEFDGSFEIVPVESPKPLIHDVPEIYEYEDISDVDHREVLKLMEKSARKAGECAIDGMEDTLKKFGKTLEDVENGMPNTDEETIKKMILLIPIDAAYEYNTNSWYMEHMYKSFDEPYYALGRFTDDLECNVKISDELSFNNYYSALNHCYLGVPKKLSTDGYNLWCKDAGIEDNIIIPDAFKIP